MVSLSVFLTAIRTSVPALMAIQVLCSFMVAGDDKWTYGGVKGPGKWSTIQERCGGDKQSPINIFTHQVVVDKTLGNLRLMNYNRTPKSGWEIVNNGHTAKITGTFEPDEQPLMDGGNLPSQYEFLQMHFHWGKGENPGSEHLLNYKRFPAELHIVHLRRDFAVNGSDDWQEESTGLAVLGVVLDIGVADNLYFEPIIKALSTIKYSGQVAVLKKMQIRDLLPNRAMMDEDLAFFRYMGSLTTPDCFESVIWTVLQQHVYISVRQYRLLQKLNEILPPTAEDSNSVEGNVVDIGHSHGESDGIVNNYRPVQPLNGRIVLANRMVKQHQFLYMSAASSLRKMLPLLFFTVAIIPFRVFMF